LRGREYGDDYTVKVPGEIDVQRARRIIEELRRRFGDEAATQRSRSAETARWAKIAGGETGGADGSADPRLSASVHGAVLAALVGQLVLKSAKVPSVLIELGFVTNETDAELLKSDSWRATRAEAPGGGMTARGIHTLDGMIQIAGLVTSVYAFSDKRKLAADVDLDDTTSMLFRFASGATGSLATVIATAETWRMQVFGSNGWAEVGDVEHLSTWTLRTCFIDRANITAKKPPVSTTFQDLSTERAELEHFARAAKEHRPLAVPGQQVINAVLLIGIVAACVDIAANNNDPSQAIFIAVLIAAAGCGAVKGFFGFRTSPGGTYCGLVAPEYLDRAQLADAVLSMTTQAAHDGAHAIGTEREALAGRPTDSVD